MSKINNLQLNKKTIFYTIVSFGLLLLSFLVFIFTKIYSRLSIILESWFSKTEVLCSCSEYLSFTNHPIVFSLILSSGLLLVLFFIFFLFYFLKISFSTHNFINQVIKNKKHNTSKKLQNIIDELLLNDKVVETEHDALVAFCFGFLNPKICISSGLVNQLSDGELRAVLLHEKTHMQSYEPVKILLLKVITVVFFWLPFLKLLLVQYLTYSEIEADQQATIDWKNKTDLAGALYKIIKNKEQSFFNNNLALSFFAVTDERINKLLDTAYIPKIKNLNHKLLTSVLMLVVVGVFFGGVLTYNAPVMVHGMAGMTCSVSGTSDDCNHQVGMVNCEHYSYFSNANCL